MSPKEVKNIYFLIEVSKCKCANSLAHGMKQEGERGGIWAWAGGETEKQVMGVSEQKSAK